MYRYTDISRSYTFCFTKLILGGLPSFREISTVLFAGKFREATNLKAYQTELAYTVS